MGAVELVGRQAEHIDAQPPDVEVEIAGGLYGVGVNDDRPASPLGLLFNDTGYLGDRLDSADLVVGVHHAYQHRLVGDSGGYVLRVHPAVPVDGQVRHVEPLLFELLARVKDGVMLDGRGDDVVAGLP